MADVYHIPTGRYIPSQPTGAYLVDPNDRGTVIPDWVLDPSPGRTAIEAIPQRHRKWTGAAVEEMTAGEKTTVDDAIATIIKAATPTWLRLKSPDGNTWDLKIDDAGAVSTTKIV